MNFTPTELALGLLALVLAAAAIYFWSRSRRTEALKSRFGPEYERTVQEVGDERKAETVLAERQKRVASYTIKPLPEEKRDQYVEAWRGVQAQFVDDPRDAVNHADALLAEVMNARGYPVKDFDQQAADLSVDHPRVVQNYRAAHDIALRHGRGEAGTEELREALIHYRGLFEELVGDAPPEPEAQTPREHEETHHG